jgi:hypothetical protein
LRQYSNRNSRIIRDAVASLAAALTLAVSAAAEAAAASTAASATATMTSAEASFSLILSFFNDKQDVDIIIEADLSDRPKLLMHDETRLRVGRLPICPTSLTSLQRRFIFVGATDAYIGINDPVKIGPVTRQRLPRMFS